MYIETLLIMIFGWLRKHPYAAALNVNARVQKLGGGVGVGVRLDGGRSDER